MYICSRVEGHQIHNVQKAIESIHVHTYILYIIAGFYQVNSLQLAYTCVGYVGEFSLGTCTYVEGYI